MSLGVALATVSSGAVAADAVVTASPALLWSVILTGGSDAATVVLYDNATAASGTVLCTMKVPTVQTVVFAPSTPVNCINGIYADVTGTAPEVNVHYQAK